MREENFVAIRAGLNAGQLEWRCEDLGAFLDGCPASTFDGFNLSDLFEYLPGDTVAVLLAKLARAGRPGARLAYWNMLAPRSRPESLAATLRPLDDLARELHARDQAFFYSRLVVEEIIGSDGQHRSRPQISQISADGLGVSETPSQNL